MNPERVKTQLDEMINLYVFETGKYPLDLYVNHDVYISLEKVDTWVIGVKDKKPKYRGVNIVCESDQ